MKDTIVLDTETGGLNPQTAALCSVSVSLIDGSNPKTWYIKPYDKEYNKKAMEINGLTPEVLEEKGINILEFPGEFYNYLTENFGHTHGWTKILAHNAKFDIDFIKESYGMYDNMFAYHNKDSMVLAESLKDAGLLPKTQSLSLVKLYEHLFSKDSLSAAAHESYADVEMCRLVYLKMLEMIKK